MGRPCKRKRANMRGYAGPLGIIISLAIVLAGIFPDTVLGQTVTKETENFANVIIFIQYEEYTNTDASSNFMNRKSKSTGETYTQKALDIWSDDSTSSKSLNNYMDAISYGRFSVHDYMPQYNTKTGKISPYVITSTKRKDIAGEVADKLAADAIGLTAADLDKNGDGKIDNLTIVASSDRITDPSDALYCHQGKYVGDKTVSGKELEAYNMINSYSAFEETAGQRNSVVIHEFMHTIGFGDLYKYDGSCEPVGVWDIMSYTSNSPQYPLTYTSKYIKNWIDIDEISEDTNNIKLVPVEKFQGRKSVIIKSPKSESEFFVCEYKKKGTDPEGLNYDLPGSGMIIYRVNTGVFGLNNYGTVPAIQVFLKDRLGSPGSIVESKNAYFSAESGRTTFGTKDMSARVNALTFSNKTNSGIVIKNISRAEDNLSFDVDFPEDDQETWKCVGTTTGLKWTSAKSTKSTISIQWNKVDNATEYEIWRSAYKMGKYSLITTVTGSEKTSFRDNGRASGTTYYYKVRAKSSYNNEKINGVFSSAVAASSRPSAPSLRSAAKDGKYEMLRWNRVNGASKYQVYKKSRRGKYIKVRTLPVSKTKYRCKKGRYKVRAYKVLNGNYLFSGFSRIK
ncbi:MAG: hypothetical protein VB031_07840 [Eubacteriaceae bacterium]|nr:hypothetical protein [Eubacteriaceae bacterium]